MALPYVVQFVNYDTAIDLIENSFFKHSHVGGLGGFFERGMRWQHIVIEYSIEYHSQLENLRDAILENNIKICGDEHQHNPLIESCPVFSDDSIATYSYRACGDLMAAIWSTEENVDYDYLDFYMREYYNQRVNKLS